MQGSQYCRCGLYRYEIRRADTGLEPPNDAANRCCKIRSRNSSVQHPEPGVVSTLTAHPHLEPRGGDVIRSKLASWIAPSSATLRLCASRRRRERKGEQTREPDSPQSPAPSVRRSQVRQAHSLVCARLLSRIQPIPERSKLSDQLSVGVKVVACGPLVIEPREGPRVIATANCFLKAAARCGCRKPLSVRAR